MIRVFEKGQPLELPLPRGKRVAVKPNLTYPRHKEGVTTSPEVLETVVAALRGAGNEVFVVESDGGYGAWTCEAAMEGHGIHALCERHGAKAVSLTKEPSIPLEFRRRGRRVEIPFPRMLAALLEGIDLRAPRRRWYRRIATSP
jgi:uncharacterized protein (DUF362 family)